MSPYELCAAPEVLARLHPRLRTYFAAIPPGHVGRGEGVFTVVGTPRRWLHPLLALFARDAVMFPIWAHDVPFTVENRPGRVGRGSGTRPSSAPDDGLEARLASASSPATASGPGPVVRPVPSPSSATDPGLEGRPMSASSPTPDARPDPDARVASARTAATAHREPRGAVAVRAHRTFRFPHGDRTMVDAITAEPTPGGSHVLVDHLGRRGRVSAVLDIAVDADGPDAGALRLVSTSVSFRVLGRAWSLPAVIAPQVRLEERFDDEAGRQRVSLVLRAPILGTLYRYEGSFTYRVLPEDDTRRAESAETGTT